MITYATLLVGFALAGYGRALDANKVYPVADLLVPDLTLQKVYPVADLLVPVNEERLKSFLRLLQDAEKDQVPFPKTREKSYLRKLLQLEKDHIPFPESDLMLPRGRSGPRACACGKTL